MAYIKLSEKVEVLQNGMSKIVDEVLEMKIYLSGQKFQGLMNDYISTHEVEALLKRLLDIVHEREDCL